MERKLAERLKANLQSLIGLYRQLLDVVRCEHQSLIDADLRAIQESTYSKEALISYIMEEERKRLATVAEFALSKHQPVEKTTLQELIIAVQGRDTKQADDLRSQWTTLRLLVERVVEQNRRNGALLEESLRHVAIMKRNVIGERNKSSETYTKRGRPSSGSPDGSQFLAEKV